MKTDCSHCKKPIETREHFHVVKRIFRMPAPLHAACVYEAGGKGSHVSQLNGAIGAYLLGALIAFGIALYFAPDALRRGQDELFAPMALFCLSGVHSLVTAVWFIGIVSAAKKLPN